MTLGGPGSASPDLKFWQQNSLPSADPHPQPKVSLLKVGNGPLLQGAFCGSFVVSFLKPVSKETLTSTA